MRCSWDSLFITMATEMSTMSTCARRHVGCVLIDGKNRILSTGYNGVPPGWPHCDPGSAVADPFYDRGILHMLQKPVETCTGATEPPGLSNNPIEGALCVANHAESNALMHCSNVDLIHTCYTTVSPCIECVKKLLCTAAQRIVFLEYYPGPSQELWLRRGINGNKREWVKYEG